MQDAEHIPTDAHAVYAVDLSDWNRVEAFIEDKDLDSDAEVSGDDSPHATDTTGSLEREVRPNWAGYGRSSAEVDVYGKIVVVQREGKRAIRSVVRHS